MISGAITVLGIIGLIASYMTCSGLFFAITRSTLFFGMMTLALTLLIRVVQGITKRIRNRKNPRCPATEKTPHISSHDHGDVIETKPEPIIY